MPRAVQLVNFMIETSYSCPMKSLNYILYGFILGAAVAEAATLDLPRGFQSPPGGRISYSSQVYRQDEGLLKAPQNAFPNRSSFLSCSCTDVFLLQCEWLFTSSTRVTLADHRSVCPPFNRLHRLYLLHHSGNQ